MMQATAQRYDKQRGSAMILVVVVTVLLSVVGIMFVMVSRLGEMESAAVIDNADIDAAVETVVAQINAVLVEDLFGADGKMLSGTDDPDNPGPDRRRDYAQHQIRPLLRPLSESIRQVGPSPSANDIWLPGTQNDIWLASLEPVWYHNNGTPNDPTDDIFIWPQITDLWGTLQGRPNSLYHQRHAAADHPMFFTDNPGVRWVDPPGDNFTAINWGAGQNQVDWARYGVSAYRVFPKIITPGSRTRVIAEDADGTDPAHFFAFGARADASGDGVADSRWVIVPNLTTSRGKPVYAAVRIIDNCAMLNLNTAYGFYQMPTANDARPWHSKPWFRYVHPTNPNNSDPYLTSDFGPELGKYLSEANVTPFFRAYDRNRVERLHRARDAGLAIATPADFHDFIIMNIESPGNVFSLFGIDDELEIRNRYLLTGRAVARFERRHLDSELRTAIPPANSYSGTLYYTFDFGRGIFGYDPTAAYQNSRVNRVPFESLSEWTDKIDLRFFDNERFPDTHEFKYSRRHISTFYSYDRPLHSGRYPLLEWEIGRIGDGTALTPAQRQALRQQVRAALMPSARAIPLDLEVPGEPEPFNNLVTRRRIVHLLYAFREHFLAEELGGDFEIFLSMTSANREAAKRAAALKAAQAVANLIDYMDDTTTTTQGPFYQGDFSLSGITLNYGAQRNIAPTFFNAGIFRALQIEVSHPVMGTADVLDVNRSRYTSMAFGVEPDTIYGYERQPFISELYCFNPGFGVEGFALELLNPYDTPINLNGWNIRVGSQNNVLDSAYVIPASTFDAPGRLTIHAGTIHTRPPAGTAIPRSNFGIGFPMFGFGDVLRLQRPDPAFAGEFLTVDQITDTQRQTLLNTTTGTNYRGLVRSDFGWRFTNMEIAASTINFHTLGMNNMLAPASGNGFQLRVADDSEPFHRLADLIKAAFIGNQKGGTAPQTITEQIAEAGSESDVRYDVESSPELLDYICFLHRPEGSLPGRININTAALHVIAAAIPPQLVMAATDDPHHALYFAEEIIAHRPYERISDLLTKVPAFQKFNNHSTVTVGDQGVRGDFEERDWILARLSNIFTVRSDTFTAWILIRLGQDGPERRMLAIFDRSQVWTPGDRPRLVALHPVSDPR